MVLPKRLKGKQHCSDNWVSTHEYDVDYGLKICSCPSQKKLYFEILTPKDDGIRRLGFGKCISHKDGTLINGISDT